MSELVVQLGRPEDLVAVEPADPMAMPVEVRVRPAAERVIARDVSGDAG